MTGTTPEPDGPERVAFVTGITGQDGYYLSRRLLDAGYRVHGLVRPGDVDVPDDRVVPHAGDLGDGPRLRELVATIAPDIVVNLGGLTSVAGSWEQPGLTARTTGSAVIELLDAAWRLGEAGRPVRFLQASSAEIFGESATVPQREDTEIRPVSPYGAAKAFAHHAVGLYRARGMAASTVILYGHESPRRPPSFVARRISSGVAAIVRGEASGLVLGNLAATRDWGWAPDFVDAMVRVLQHDTPGDFVVSTGEAHSVAEVVSAAFAAAGLHDPDRYVRSDPTQTRPSDGALQIGDAGRIRQLGWAPTRTFVEVVTALVEADLGVGADH